MHFPSEEYRSISIIPFDIAAIRVFNQTLGPTNMQICISCSPSNDKVGAEAAHKAEEGMRRLVFWFETALTNVILVDVNSELFTDIILNTDNSIMYCPGPPTDHLLVELLHSKINSIAKRYFNIHAVSITSDDTNQIETAFRNLDGYELPNIKYYPEETLHKMPWWERDTIEVCEFTKGEILEEELYNHFSDYFDKSKDNVEADIIIFKSDDEDGQV